MDLSDFDSMNNTNGTAKEILLRELFNAEMSGNRVGFNSRFGTQRHQQEIRLAQKEEKRSLDQLLLISSYHEAHQRAARALHGLFNHAYEMREKARLMTESSKLALEQALDNAHTLPDGTKIFRAEGGAVMTAEGEELPAGDYDFPEGATTWEDYQKRKQALKAAQDYQARVQHINDVELPSLQKRWDAHNNGDPMSEGELKDFEKKVQSNLKKLEIAPQKDFEISKPSNDVTQGLDFSNHLG